MFFCAQLTPSRVCYCVASLTEAIKADNIILIQDLNERYIGKKYNNGVFYGLEAKVEGKTVNVSWCDLNGNLIDETEEVRAKYNNAEIVVGMNNGQGSFTVEASPGVYRIEIVSASGCRTSVEVTV